MQVLYWPVLGQIQFCSFDRPVLIQNRFCNLPHQNRLCACSKTNFVPTLNQPLQNRLCACSKNSFVPSLNLLHQNRLCAYAQPAAPKLALCLLQNRLCAVSEVRCDCHGLGLLARIEASILVFDTIQVLYWSVLAQIKFCGFDRRCKTCIDTKPVLYQGRFCSLTDVRQLFRLYSNDLDDNNSSTVCNKNSNEWRH